MDEDQLFLHPAEPVEPKGPPDTNARRGLMRLWVVGTFAWIIYWSWYLAAHCSPVSDNSYYLVACTISTFNSTASGYVNFSDAFGLYILLPSALLAFGYLIAWAIRGFDDARTQGRPHS